MSDKREEAMSKSAMLENGPAIQLTLHKNIRVVHFTMSSQAKCDTWD